MKKNHYLSYGNVESWRDRLQASPKNGHSNNDDWADFELYGSPLSPPCVKVASYLKWKRLPSVWRPLISDSMKPVFAEARFLHIQEHTVPIAVFPDGRSMNDSSFILRAVEEQFPRRSAIPSVEDDPYLRFVCLLLEDFADEWLVRCVYGFRWNDPEVRDFSGRLLGLTNFGGGELSQQFAKFVVPRQLDTENRSDAFIEGAYTDSIIYPTFDAVADAMEKHFSQAFRFMCGNSPSLIDFAFYGHFFQFIQDRIPAVVMVEKYPHTTAWTQRMQDSSGYDPATLVVTELLSELLKIVAQTHLVFLEANAKRFADNREDDSMITVAVLGESAEGSVMHSQRPYAYQAKCLEWLQEELQTALKSNNKERVDALRIELESTHCWDFLSMKSDKA